MTSGYSTEDWRVWVAAACGHQGDPPLGPSGLPDPVQIGIFTCSCGWTDDVETTARAGFLNWLDHVLHRLAIGDGISIVIATGPEQPITIRTDRDGPLQVAKHTW